MSVLLHATDWHWQPHTLAYQLILSIGSYSVGVELSACVMACTCQIQGECALIFLSACEQFKVFELFV